MTPSEWLWFIAVIDGPMIGLLYLVCIKIRNEIK